MGNEFIGAKKVWFTDMHVFVELSDERIIGSPLHWFPRLSNASAAQRENFEISKSGYGIHWPDLDEDLSAEGFLTFTKQAGHVIKR
jgi:hypothetical protein